MKDCNVDAVLLQLLLSLYNQNHTTDSDPRGFQRVLLARPHTRRDGAYPAPVPRVCSIQQSKKELVKRSGHSGMLDSVTSFIGGGGGRQVGA